MKRDAYGDDGPHQKRQRQADDEVTFLIPSKVAGSIIGKGGANISKLRDQQDWMSRRWSMTLMVASGGATACLGCRSRPRTPPPRTRHATQYKASITVPDCPGPERVLSISADDVDTILEIVKDVLPNLADAGGPNFKGNNEDLDVRLLIHQSRAGCVIGKGGVKIKELREKTGARLKIFSNPAPQSTERVVQLVGKADSVAAGVREVLELVHQVPIKGPVQAYDPHNYDDYYAEEYGGFGIGQGGGMRGGRGRSPPRGPSGGRGPPGAAPGRGPPRPPMGRGPPPPAFGDFPGPAPGPPPRSYGGPPRGGFGGGFGSGGFGGRGAPPPPAPAFAQPNGAPPHQDTSTQVTIPKDLAGAIIGKAGSRIRKIRQESGAGIEIAEPLPGSSDRIITITGSPQRIQMAQYLLQQSVHESNPNLGGGGGRSNF